MRNLSPASASVAVWLCLLCHLPGTRALAQNYFRDASQEVGLARFTGKNYALAIADVDGDGLEDLFVGRNREHNIFFRNLGNGTFADDTGFVGIIPDNVQATFTATFGDLDNDGDQDLYVGNRLAPDQLFRNDRGRFTEVTRAAGIANVGAPRSVNFSDINRDGLLDIYIVNFGEDNQLYLNQGDLTFTEEAASRNATDADNRLGMAAIFIDFDLDGDDDLYLVHDGNQANLMLRNDGSGHFTDASAFSGTAYRANGMGVASGDLTGDGLPDLYITNLDANALLVNQGNGTFRDRSEPAGVTDEGMGWGTSLLDIDNDGALDIYAVNDSYFSPFANVLYRNDGSGRFTNVTNLTVEGSPFGGIACAGADVNRDGWPDLLVTNTGATGGLQYFENLAVNDYHWLRVKLRGTTSNRDAVGAVIRLYNDDREQVRVVTAGSGYAAQESLWQHFGLGPIADVDSLTIDWPSGLRQVVAVPAVDRELEIVEGGSIVNLPDRPTVSAVAVYPNPTSGVVNISGLQRTTPYRLFDGLGRLLSFGRLVPGAPLELTSQPAGVYLLRLDSPGSPSPIRLVKR